jgi:hypothetical protein
LASFEEIGYIDPAVNHGKTKTEKIINAMNINKNIYPDKFMLEGRPPKCVFVPDKQLMRKIIKL